MHKLIHRSNSRGHSKYSWLDSHHSFSFGNYHDTNRVHFGALRVLNDDIILGGGGFDTHPHDNMEIITIPIYGALKHKDSMGHEQIISENEVQVMSAGTGIFHSEYNASPDEKANFLQIWIYPNIKNINPTYDQKYFKTTDALNQWQYLVSAKENAIESTLNIQQNAFISRIILHKGKEVEYVLKPTSFGSYIFVISGKIQIDSEIYFP
jgi:redox-sensitive bicupin YhaK (pirin superfamily)